MTRVSPHICIVTQWYPPEQAPFGLMMRELAGGLVNKQWSVTVITGFPNHPHGKVFDGFRKRWLSESMHQGVLVKRVWLATSTVRSFVNRSLGFITFTFTSSWRLLRERDVDVIFAVLQPLSLGLVLPVIAKIKGAKLVFNLQDLHPDTQVRLGMIRNPLLIGLLRRVEKFAYKSCARITVICDAFKDHCIQNGIQPKKISVIENWVDTERLKPMSRDNEFRRSLGYNSDDFVVLWAGTLGYVSGAEVVLEASKILKDHPRVRFLIVGEGPIRSQLIATASSAELLNVKFVPFQSEERLPLVQATANVSLVTIDPRFAASSVPSKVLAYMAAGRAIVAAVPSDCTTARLLERASCARVVNPASPSELADVIASLAVDATVVRDLEICARAFAERSISTEFAVAAYDSMFTELLTN
jgi:colanic acid biosynthesis glycosyl transferase WcaI